MIVSDGAHAGDLVLYAARVQLPRIRREYEASLQEKTVSPALLIEIKNLFENLKSALDFTTCGLFESYGSSKNKKPKIYFPYAKGDQTQAAFEKSRRERRNCVSLVAEHPCRSESVHRSPSAQVHPYRLVGRPRSLEVSLLTVIALHAWTAARWRSSLGWAFTSI